MTYQVGSIAEFMWFTKRLVADPAAKGQAPNRWFDSIETARRALAARPPSN